MKNYWKQEWSIQMNKEELNDWFEKRMEHYPHFGRDMELLLMYTKIAHSRRIYGKPVNEIRILTIDDLNEGQNYF